MEQVLQQHVLNVVQQMEDRVDDQIHAMDKLQGDDYEALRQQRLQVRPPSFFRGRLPASLTVPKHSTSREVRPEMQRGERSLQLERPKCHL